MTIFDGISMAAVAINVVSAVYTMNEYIKWRKTWTPIMYVINVPGQGPKLTAAFTDLPPVGTVFYMRVSEPVKEAM